MVYKKEETKQRNIKQLVSLAQSAFVLKGRYITINFRFFFYKNSFNVKNLRNLCNENIFFPMAEYCKEQI